MKRTITLLLALVLCFSCTACGNNKNSAVEKKTLFSFDNVSVDVPYYGMIVENVDDSNSKYVNTYDETGHLIYRDESLWPRTYEYDENGRIEKIFEVGNTTSGKSKRTWAFTYNEQGLRETETWTDVSEDGTYDEKYGYSFKNYTYEFDDNNRIKTTTTIENDGEKSL